MEDKLRDHVGLIQDRFQWLLKSMCDTIGLIQRNAGLDPEKDAELYQTYKYEDIHLSAKAIVETTLVIDALIDEASETLLGRGKEEILTALKAESEKYKSQVAELPAIDEKAKIWLDRVNNMLQIISNNSQIFDEEEEI